MGPNGYGYMPDNQQYPMQPRQQPSFQSFASQQNIQQPYVQRPQMLMCRFVDDPSKIMPVDVPSNGEPAFFVDRNFSYIIGKAVNSRGTIDDIIYEPVHRQSPEQVQEEKLKEFQAAMIARFENLEHMIEAFLTQPSTDQNKKENGGTK